MNSDFYKYPFLSEVWGTASDWAIFVATIFTAILLYKTLKRQSESNEEQRLKNESDIIFLLFNQLEVEYNNFSIVTTTTRNGQVARDIHTGYTAMCKLFPAYKSSDFAQFKEDIQTDQLMSLLQSLGLIAERLNHGDLKGDFYYLFARKLYIYYKTKFAFPVESIIKTMGHTDDPIMEEIKILHFQLHKEPDVLLRLKKSPNN